MVNLSAVSSVIATQWVDGWVQLDEKKDRKIPTRDTMYLKPSHHNSRLWECMHLTVFNITSCVRSYRKRHNQPGCPTCVTAADSSVYTQGQSTAIDKTKAKSCCKNRKDVLNLRYKSAMHIQWQGDHMHMDQLMPVHNDLPNRCCIAYSNSGKAFNIRSKANSWSFNHSGAKLTD